ncbi:MAG: fasciclin domain-containing protein [Actinobacteria bacterium]|nr:fasciclin domain-containing protein [Actinomycetota bacterium]
MKRSLSVIGLLATVVLGVSACSSSGGSSTSSSGVAGATGASSSAMSSGSTSSDSMSGSASSAASSAQFGSGCSQVPSDPSNPGSFDAMAKVPVATAASGNPLLSTVVSAVKAAGLVDTLNNAQNITVFAPDNDAFSKIPAATLQSVLADKSALTKILTYHVIGQRLTPAQVTGALTSLEGGAVEAMGTAPNISVGPTGTEAHIVCGNIQTANATVYIIDSVMMPAS